MEEVMSAQCQDLNVQTTVDVCTQALKAEISVQDQILFTYLSALANREIVWI
jgi:hypothetical protein